MLRLKDTSKLLTSLLRAIPEIPFIAPRKRKSSLTPFVLGAIGVALAGGLAAVMIFLPRTRHRALGLAKEGYGKVRGQLDHLGSSEKVRMSPGAMPKRAPGSGPNYQSAGS